MNYYKYFIATVRRKSQILINYFLVLPFDRCYIIFTGIYILTTLFTSFTGYIDDVFKVISNFHSQRYKFGQKSDKFGGKSEEDKNLVQYLKGLNTSGSMLRLGRNDSISQGGGEMVPPFQPEKHEARRSSRGVVEAEQQGGGDRRGFRKEEPRKPGGGGTLEAQAFFLPAAGVVAREGQTAGERR